VILLVTVTVHLNMYGTGVPAVCEQPPRREDERNRLSSRASIFLTMPSDVGSQTVALGWGPASDQIGGKTRELNLQYTIDINFYMYM